MKNNNKKEKYIPPVIELVTIPTQDVLTVSTPASYYGNHGIELPIDSFLFS